MGRRLDDLASRNFERVKAQTEKGAAREVLKACLDYNLELKLSWEKGRRAVQRLLGASQKELRRAGQELRNLLMFK